MRAVLARAGAGGRVASEHDVLDGTAVERGAR